MRICFVVELDCILKLFNEMTCIWLGKVGNARWKNFWDASYVSADA